MPPSASLLSAPERIAAYLADHDLTCPSCGYQLRGVKGLQCPECGWVITHPDLNPEPPQSRRFTCRKCSYDLTKTSLAVCPECGESAVTRAPVDWDLMSRWFDAPPDRVPRALKVLAVLSCFSPLATVGAVVRSGTSLAATRPIRTGDIFLAIIFAAVAPLFWILWNGLSKRLCEKPPETRRLVAILGALAGFSAIMGAVGLFMSI